MVLGLGAAAFAGMADVPPEPLMAKKPEVVVTSDYTGLTAGSIKGQLGRERKNGTRGNARMTIEIKSEPLVHVFDDVAQAQLLASASAEVLRKKVTSISETASPRTLETRKYQETAYKNGEAWAVGRFGFRGQMGPRHFDGGGRMFNHSGTFAQSIVATPNKTEGNATINVAKNRLDPTTSGAGEFRHITDALIRLVPELGDPAALMQTPEVMKALDDSVEQMIFNAAKRNKQLRGQLGAALIDNALGALGLGGLRGRVVSAFYG